MEKVKTSVKTVTKEVYKYESEDERGKHIDTMLQDGFEITYVSSPRLHTELLVVYEKIEENDSPL